MQSTLYTAPSSSYQLNNFTWKTKETPFLHQKPISNIKNPRKTLCVLSSSINYEPGEGIDKGCLPVVLRKSGKVSRYFWDGELIRLVGVDGDDSTFSLDSGDGFYKFVRGFRLAIRNFLIPKRVNENYLEYVKWKFLHRVFSSALQVLATQAMFRAIGIGYARSLPSAAALNWVLKDGLGRLSRCIYTASLASAFDTNLKRVRFSTSVIFTLSIGVELLTPVFPQYFLLLASIANIAKQISLACYLATSSAVHRSFAVSDNLGEVSAKAQIQSVCFDNIGLMLAALLNILFKNDKRLQAGLPFIVYPIFSAVDLFGIYQGLKHVHLQTLTKDRLEIILRTWIKLRYVPSPAEVSKEEEIDFLWTKDEKLWPIRIGCLNPKNQISKLSMMAMRSITGNDHYFIGIEICKGFTRSSQGGLFLCLREGVGTEDIFMGLLQASYIRKALLSSKSRLDNIVNDNDPSDSVMMEWLKLMKDSKLCAQKESSLVKEQMLALGWAVQNILLSTGEQERYSFVDN